MEDKVKQILEEYGLTESQLTKEELDELKEEIKANEEGYLILDGVLSNPELFYRKRQQEGTRGNEK